MVVWVACEPFSRRTEIAILVLPKPAPVDAVRAATRYELKLQRVAESQARIRLVRTTLIQTPHQDPSNLAPKSLSLKVQRSEEPRCQCKSVVECLLNENRMSSLIELSRRKKLTLFRLSFSQVVGRTQARAGRR